MQFDKLIIAKSSSFASFYFVLHLDCPLVPADILLAKRIKQLQEGSKFNAHAFCLLLLYNRFMAKIATKLEDVGDENWQRIFAAITDLWFNGDQQAMLDWYNKKGQELEELEKQPGVVRYPNGRPTEVQLRFKH
jgi:hypothetical protein